MNQRTSIGLDVHARSVVACGLDGQTGELFERRLTPDHGEIVDWSKSLPAPVAVIYEAGPTGFGLARSLTAAGIECLVAAPSKLQRPPGDRIKNDARDARHLARPLHLGHIVEGIVYYGGHTWMKVHDTWLRAQHFDAPGLQLAYETAYDTMLATVDRRDRLDVAIAAMATDSDYTPGGDAARRPARSVHAERFGLAVEIGDWQRLTGRSIGAYLGLVPTEHSSGATRSQGSITKTGNGHARRQLIEAAWHHRPRYHPGVELRRRCDHESPAARARGQQANRRLHARWAGFDVRNIRPALANTAIVRELAGWRWSLAVLDT
jgi:hypothetical protein